MPQMCIYKNRLVYFQVLFISTYAHIHKKCAATTMRNAEAVGHIYLEVEFSQIRGSVRLPLLRTFLDSGLTY